MPVFKSMIRENKTLFSSAPIDGYPVVLQGGQNSVITEIEEATTEFEKKIRENEE